MKTADIRPLYLKKWIDNLVTPKVPRDISSHFRDVGADELREISMLLEQHYFSKPFTPDGFLASDEGKNDMHNHLAGRLNGFRSTVLPWLNDAQPLAGKQILEVGCGTGSSTVALAEQGARVTAMDIDVGALTVAKERCRVYGLDVTFVEANATQIRTLFSGRHFDLIIFFAVLEHMTHDERMIAMSDGWNMLSAGDLWCVIETPNRLWFYDGHTSFLPFYLWLPDDVAFEYSRFSPRKSISELSSAATVEARLAFLRKGRSISFHEFELSMDRAEALDVLSSLSGFLRKRSVWRDILWRLTFESRYQSLLTKAGPHIHSGFYAPFLDLIIRKH